MQTNVVSSLRRVDAGIVCSMAWPNFEPGAKFFFSTLTFDICSLSFSIFSFRRISFYFILSLIWFIFVLFLNFLF